MNLIYDFGGPRQNVKGISYIYGSSAIFCIFLWKFNYILYLYVEV